MKKRNAIQTKELILNTAIQEFARSGFDGLRVDDLALKAEVNKATIYYHFKDKSFIFEKIVFDFTQFILKEITKKLKAKSEPKEKIEAFLDALSYVISTKREMGRILMQELSFNGKNINDHIKKEFFKIIKLLVNIINEGIEKKVFKKVNPFLIHATLVGSINYYYSMQSVAQISDNNVFSIPFEDNTSEIKEMILSYILA